MPRKPKKADTSDIPALEDLLAHSTVGWYDEMLKSYTKNPDSFEARLLVAEAFIGAIQIISERHPEDGLAIKKYLIAKLQA